jgi:large subunit ribosomal protein L30
MSDKTIKVKLVKGLAGCKQSHRDTVRGLGLKRIGQTVELKDTPAIRGMIDKVYYLVRAEG